MNKLIILAIFLLGSSVAFADTAYNVVTGYGYLTDSNGHIISKAEYNVGATVTIPSGITYTEVANQSAFDAIAVYQAPVSPVNAFNTDIFVEQLAQTSLVTNPAIMQYYAVLKDMTFYKNFQGLADLIAGLLQGGAINQSQVDTIDTVLENQQINLDSYNSEVNVAY